VGPANNDKPVGLVVDSSGNAIVTSASYNGFNPDYPDIQTIKYAAADGQVVWQRRYDSARPGAITGPLALRWIAMATCS